MSKPLVHQIAERARGFIADTRKWTQYAIARTGNNRHCEPTDAKATRCGCEPRCLRVRR